MHRKTSERCQSGETETSLKSGQPGTRRGRGTSAQLSGRSADEDVVAGWIEHPVVAFARIVVVARYFDETFVETQIVADRVLPSLLVVAIIRKVLHDELVDSVEG